MLLSRISIHFILVKDKVIFTAVPEGNVHITFIGCYRLLLENLSETVAVLSLYPAFKRKFLVTDKLEAQFAVYPTVKFIISFLNCPIGRDQFVS